ncbi:lipid A deacylase LpxR family protein [Leptospira sp. GIMC2001]|uniref:lipid A deacylase LpxR family protein n=1 Tax=Leptospira sp. GIMC2001 TaxID=1513297 RepID=UPI00234ADCB9|nr:lipid A deacylase LpxR family protein [Leptospira sp. GIMC2001]WCL49323.1 lipid A deacylase LpxR family protein [Leptospira sp. GIMC2001]
MSRPYSFKNLTIIKVFLFLLFLGITSEIQAQYQIRMLSENDSYGGFSDRYYTNGGRIEFHMDAEKYNPTRFAFEGWNNLFVTTSPETKHFMGISVGQEFYTPSNIKKSEVSYGDRPYASRAYLGSSLTTWSSNASVTSEIEIGLLGPDVGGKNAQKKFHNYIGSPIPQGWDTQIGNQTSLALKTDIRKFYHPYFGMNYHFTVGNVQADASVSVIFRWGNVGTEPGPGFNALSPGPPVLQNPGVGYWYFYLNPGGTFQGYNGTIQGKMGDGRVYRSDAGNNFLNSDSAIFQTNASNDIIGNLIVNSLYEDNGNNSIDRYILYQLFLVRGSENPYGDGLNYILFNNIFNSSEEIEAGLKIYLFSNILETWPTLDENARIVALYSLFRPEGQKLPVLARYLSYEILSQYILDPNQRLLFLTALQQGLVETEGKTYVANLRRAVGFIRAGFVFVSDAGLLLSLNYNYSTVDFEPAPGLPEGHQWLGFQLGKVF